MQKTIFKDKYPICTLEIKKNELDFNSVSEIIEYFKNKINAHPVAKFIAIFKHYEHTISLKESKIAPEIKDIENILFCFGKEIPSTKVAAVRPRSIGVCELEDKFVIEFMEAPSEQLNSVMEEWAKGLL